MKKIQVRELSVELNGNKILENIDLSFYTNERILLLGESGSGKSTLLLSVMGLLQRSEHATVTGDIVIDGRSVRDMKLNELARIFGMVFQNPESQFCTLYPRDEVAFGLENQCIPSSKMDAVIDDALGMVGIEKSFESLRVNQLSGGMQQRLAVASIMAIGSEMLIFDEPTANLDPLGRMEIVEAANLAGNKGKGILLVEHNLEEWLDVIDRVLVMDDQGQLLFDGSVMEVLVDNNHILEEKGIWRPRMTQLVRRLKDQHFPITHVPASLEDIRCDDKDLLKKLFIKEQEESPVGDSAQEGILKIEGLTAGYKKNQPVLRDIGFDVHEGDFFALVGRNGSGKSTLSKVLLKMLNGEKGKIQMLGQDMKDIKTKDLYDAIGYVFQNPEHQFIEDSVWSEIAYSVRLMEGDSEKVKEEAVRLLKDFSLYENRRDNPFSLSGGQKRRLSVATMLTGSRKLLILDEPTFGQDEKNATMLMDKLKELNRQGMTIFMITHDMALVSKYTNRTAVLSEGRITYCGDTKNLWQESETLCCAGLNLPFDVKLRRWIEEMED